MRSASSLSYTVLDNKYNFILFSSLRIIFSIGDIQAEEDFQDPEGEEDPEAENVTPYPVRASLSITKVLFLFFLPYRSLKY